MAPNWQGFPGMPPGGFGARHPNNQSYWAPGSYPTNQQHPVRPPPSQLSPPVSAEPQPGENLKINNRSIESLPIAVAKAVQVEAFAAFDLHAAALN